MKFGRSTNSNLSLYIFFSLSPFIYSIQVVLKSPEVAILPYIILSAGILLFFLNKRKLCLKKINNSETIIILGMLFITLHNFISSTTAITSGDIQYGTRGLFLFSIPLVIFWIVQKSGQRDMEIILVILAICGLIICGELLYEDYLTKVINKTTRFQLENREYVIMQTGNDLTQLWIPSYRSPGLLEHVHAVTFFAALASLANMILFCLRGKWYWLISLAVCTMALLMHGVRIPVVASMAAFAIFWMLFNMTEKDQTIRKRGLIVLSTVITLTIFQLVIDPLGTAKTYYWSALLHGDFQIPEQTATEIIAKSISQTTYESEWGKLITGQTNNLFTALLGYGITGSLHGLPGFSDDFFFLSVISQYGIIGAIVFFSTWILSAYIIISKLLSQKITNYNDRALLYFGLGILIILGLSMLHSGALQRKAIYPYFPLAVGIAWRDHQKRKTGIQ